jgi:hypothetical protein
LPDMATPPRVQDSSASMGDSGPVTIASPLPYLLAEEKTADRQAREALFCTFNADLGFFERTVLGVTQATGARVTVIGDGRMSDPDPRAARNAGTRYLHGLAVTASTAAFHPKVAIIAGPERAVAAIGSGNLSTGGWFLNTEMWTVCTADRECCPVLVAQLAKWLRTLDGVCTITPQAISGIQRTAALLEQLAGASTLVDTGDELVHTSGQSILDQLPDGHAGHLRIYAPFHDEKAEAIRSLIQRLDPLQVTLAVQSGRRTVIQPDAVARMTDDLGVQLSVIEDPSTEYRHGKLIEVADDGGNRWALTGSANLSARALVHAVEDGGNIELGIISRSRPSLLPQGRPITLAEVPAVRIGSSAANRPATGVLLIAAVRTEDGLKVSLAKPSVTSVRIQSSARTSFDSWSEIGLVPPGSIDHIFADVDLPGGTRVRGAWDAGAGVVYGSVVFVVDLELVLNRPGETAGHGRAAPPDPLDLITDPRLLEVWLAALGQLAAAPPAVTVPRVAGSGAPRGEGSTSNHDGGLRVDTDEERWLAYADEAQARMGTAMFRFALGGFPALRALSSSADGSLEEPTDRVIDERKAGLEDDDSETVNDDVDPADDDDEPAQDGNNGPTGASKDDRASGGDGGLPESMRRRTRRQLEKWFTDTAHHSPVIARLAVIQLLLCAIQSHFWETALGDQGWMRVLGTAIKTLNVEDTPERISSQTASVAAVAIYLMHEHRPTSERTADVLRYEDAARETAHLYADSDPQMIADFAEPFINRNGYPIDPDAVMHVITMIVQGDPITEAMDLLEDRHPSWQIHRHDGALLHISSSFRTPFLPAAEALDAITGTTPVAVWVTGGSGDWSVAARQADTLIRVDKQRRRIMWWHYRLSSLISPTGIARDPELANRARIPHGPLSQAFPEAHRALAAVGFDPADDPPAVCPVLGV